MEEQVAPTRESLLADAEAHDAVAGVSVEKASNPEEKVSEASDTEPSKPDAEPEKETEGSSVSEVKEGESAKESKPKSKWAANEERKSKTWNELNADKEALKKEREAFSSEQSRLRSERDEFTKAKAQPNSEFRDEKGHTVRDYEDAAKRFDNDGDDELAKMARDKAGKLQSLESQGRQERAVQEFNQKWLNNYTKLAEKDPDLKNESSDTYKQVMNLLQKYPLLTKDPDGLSYAYEAVSVGRKGRGYDTAQAENAKLREELGKYQKKLAIGGGVATEQPQGEKAFDKLSQEEQRKRLMASADEFDRTMR